MQYRWIIFICCVLLTYTRFLTEVSYGRVIPDLLETFPTAKMATLQWTGSAVAAIGALFVWQVLLLIKTFGYKWTVRIGVILGTIGLVLASLSLNEFQLMVSYGLIFGFGGVFIINVGLFLIAANFPPDDDHHVFTTSFKLSVYPLAVASVPITNQLLQIWNWRIVYVIYGGVIMVLGFAVSTMFGNHKACPDNEDTDKSTRDDHNLSKEAKKKMFIIAAVKMLESCILSMYVNVPIYILPKHSQQLGLTLQQGTALVSYFGISEASARLATAFLGDGILKNRILYVYTVSYGLGALVNSLLGYTASTNTSLVIYSVTMGALTGPLAAAFYASCSEMLLGYYTNELFSSSNVGLGIGFLLGALLQGFVFDLTGSYKYVYLVMSALQTVTAILTVVIILVRMSLKKVLLRDTFKY